MTVDTTQIIHARYLNTCQNNFADLYKPKKAANYVTLHDLKVQ